MSGSPSQPGSTPSQFNASPTPPHCHPSAAGFHRKLIREWQDDVAVFAELKKQGVLSKHTLAKLREAADFEKLRNEIGADPVVVGIASKDEVYKRPKVIKFLDLLLTPLCMLGVKMAQGAGPNGMKLFGSRYNLAMKRLAAAGYKTLWRPGVIGCSLDIGKEPLNREHTKGWHHGPWRDVSRRTDALVSTGFVPAVIGLHSGDSGLLEFFRYKTARKPGQVDVLDGPFNGYPSMPHLLQVEHKERMFWAHIHEAQRSMSTSGDIERAQRKRVELEELEAECLWINGELEAEAERAFNLVDSKMGRFFGIDPTIAWQQLNGIDRSVFHIAREIVESSQTRRRPKLRLADVG